MNFTLQSNLRRAIVILLLVAVAGIAVLWLERRSEIELPAPTGPFAVGRAIYDWAGDGHEVLAWIWYPAATPQSPVTEPYVPAPMLAAVARRRAGVWRWLTHDWAKVRPHALRDAEVSPRQRSYPVVIFRGGASAEVVNYTTLVEDLASHGYVVVGIDAPGRTGIVVLPDGRVIQRESNPEMCPTCIDKLLAAWTADIGFAVDRLAQLDGRFAGRLDMTRVGVFGHSFGGAQAAQFCSVDPRCKAGVDVDGLLLGSVVQTGIHKPFMFLLSDHSRESGPEHDRVERDLRSVYDRLPPASRRYVVIPGANHFTFSDDGAVLKSRLVRAMMRLFGILRIDARRQVAIAAESIHTFFDAHL